MEFKPRFIKDGAYYLVELLEIDAMTQGRSKKEAELMAQDLLHGMIDAYFDKEVEVTMYKDKQKDLVLTAPDEYAIPLVLRRLRETSHKTIEDISQACGFKSPNAYAQYEQGHRMPGFDQFRRFLEAMNATIRIVPQATK